MTLLGDELLTLELKWGRDQAGVPLFVKAEPSGETRIPGLELEEFKTTGLVPRWVAGKGGVE